MKLIDEKDLWVGAMKLMHGPENQSCGNLFGDSRREEERTRVEAMAHSQPRPRRMLGLAAASLSLLLVQNAFGFLFRHTGANLSPRTLYRNLDALTDMVLPGSSHVVDHLKTLYELRQLALGASHAERSSVPVSLSSPLSSSAQEAVCNYRAVPAPSLAEDRRLLFGRRGTHFSSVRRRC